MRKLILFIWFVVVSMSLVAQITEIGLASFYADKFDGRITASGDIFDQNKLTAAHRTLPFGSKVKVTNLENNTSIIVTVNDRGPFVNDRVIDLSKMGARKLNFISKGVVKVKIEVLSIPDEASSNKSPAYTPPAKTDESISFVSAPNLTTGIVSEQAVEYYKVESIALQPTGFGIQIASYKEAANLIKRCDELRLEIGKDVIIQVANNNGEKVYRIIVGPFESKEKADAYNEKLPSNFKGSFVISF